MNDETPTRLYPPKVRRWLPAVVLALVVLYGLAVNGYWAMRPDSGVYMTLGRSVAEGRGMEFCGRQSWGYPPLVPFLIAGCRWLAGSHAMWLINAVMSLFGIGTALAALGIASRVSVGETERVRIQLAVGTFLVVGVSARLFGDATRVLTDVPFTFFLSLGLYLMARARGGHWAWCLAAGLALLAGAMTRPVMVVFVPAVLAAMALDWRRAGYGKRLAGTVAAVAMVAAGFAYWWVVLRSWSDPASADYSKAISGGYLSILSPDRWSLMAREVAGIPAAVCGALFDQRMSWNHIGLVWVLPVVVGLVAAGRRHRWLVVLPVAFYVAFLIAWGAGAMDDRYLLPVMPLLAYGLLLGVRVIVHGLTCLVRRSDAAERRAAVGVVVAAGLCVAISLAKNVSQTIYWARHEKFYKYYGHGHWRGIVEVSRAIRDCDASPTDVVATKEGSVVHYLTGRQVAVLPLWTRDGPGLGRRPPKVFAELAAKGDFRFVIVPLDKAGWSEPTVEAVEATGAFHPAQRFRDMALFQRW
jgi:4-amino-4-deoxy-L-arabinose transferase-like glycosyltransferase